MVKKQTIAVFLESSRISLCLKDTNNILQLDLPPDTVSDLEVIDRDKFEQLVNSFFQTDAFKGIEFDVALVFSRDVTFEKDFTDNATKVNYEEIQKFLDIVPFEDILSKTYKINRKAKIVAVNRSLYDVICLALEKNKAYISLVVPMAILAETTPELSTNVDLAFIAARSDSFRQYSFIEVKEANLKSEQKNSIGIKKKDVRLYALLGIFALLFLILLMLIYTTFFSSPKKNKKPVVLPKASVSTTIPVEMIPSASQSGNISSPSSSLRPTH